MDHALDNPVWAALTGPQAALAQRLGRAALYPEDVSPFAALADGPGRSDGAAWADLAALAGPDRRVLLADAVVAPAGWERLAEIPGVQMDGTAAESGPDAEAVVLGPRDVPAMLDLVARTRPGPFGPRTHELGTYLGIRRGGALVAMAGERMRPSGWGEISAVCTDPAHRGHGLASRLVRAVAAAVRARGDVPFLHASASNTAAIRLYEQMGFRLRREPVFGAFRTPADVPARVL